MIFEPAYSDSPRKAPFKETTWRPGFYGGDAKACLCHVTLNFTSNNMIDKLPKIPDSIETAPLYQLIKPYLDHMQIFGLFFIDEPSKTSPEQSYSKKKYSRISTLIQFSSSIFYALPFMIQLEFESYTVLMLVACFWTLQNGFTSAICYSMCTKVRKFRRLFQNWSELIACPTEMGEIEEYIKKKRNVIVVFCWVFNVIFTIGWILTLSGWIGDPVELSFHNSISPGVIHVMRVLFVATTFLGAVAWTLPMGLFVLLCLSISRLLNAYNGILSKAVEFILHGGIPAGTKDPFKSESFRIKHQKVLRLIETTNNMFGLFVLTMLLINMAILCFASYMFLFVCSTPFTKVLEALWTIVSTAWLLILSVVGAMLHSAAHKPYDELHAVPLSNMSTDNIVKLIVFLNRVGGPEIGISAWGFSVLSKNFLSTLASILLSYFFLLVQFQSPNGLSSCPEVVPLNKTHLLH